MSDNDEEPTQEQVDAAIEKLIQDGLIRAEVNEDGEVCYFPVELTLN